jgi:hypothetical protein
MPRRCGKTYRGGRDVRKVGGDTGGVDDIVQSELIDEGGELQQKGQGLWMDGQHAKSESDVGSNTNLSNTARGTGDNFSRSAWEGVTPLPKHIPALTIFNYRGGLRN